MPGIFINYRRIDSGGWAGRIYDRLVERFGADRVFMDVDDIPPGVDFAEFIADRMRLVDVMVSIIGDRWVSVANEQGQPRIKDPNDLLHSELATALLLGVKVVPVLVDGASMPAGADLPQDVEQLHRLNAIEISETRFDEDVGRLLEFVAETVRPSSRGFLGRFPYWRRGLEIAVAAAVIVLVSIGVWGLLNGREEGPEVDGSTSTASVTTSSTSTTAVATSTMALTIESPPTEWPRAFLDTFNIDTGRWSTGSLDDPQFGTVNRTIAGGVYMWDVIALDEALWRSVDDDFETTDFYAAAEATLVSGTGSFGIVFRHADPTNFYLVMIEDAQFLSVSAQIEGEWRTIFPRTRLSSIRRNGSNRLAVIGIGSNYQVYVNRVLVEEILSEPLTGGLVGLAVEVEEAGGQTTVEFDTFELRCATCDQSRITTTTASPRRSTTPPTTLPPTTPTTVWPPPTTPTTVGGTLP